MKSILLLLPFALLWFISATPQPEPVDTDERLGLFLQPGQADAHRKLIRDLNRYAHRRNMEFAVVEAAQLPAELSATPALIYQNTAGRTIYPGMHLDAEAMQLFVDGNRLALRAVELDFRRSVAYLQNGRSTTALVLKLTPWSGSSDSPDSLQWEETVQAAIADYTAFRERGEAGLWPTDRRYYLDLHAYRDEQGRDFLTYAVFSQFNCHEPIFTNYDRPATDLAELLRAVDERLRPYWAEPGRGFTPMAITTTTTTSWEELGWRIPAGRETSRRAETASQPGTAWVAAAGNLRPRARPADLPMVQFNFPPPLDRYAGTVESLDGQIEWSDNGQSISGEFEVDLRNLTMGNDGLDHYVRDDALRTRRFRTATLRFTDAQLPENWQVGQTQDLLIPARLELMGISVPIELQAQLEANYDRAGNPCLLVSTLMELRIDQPFELRGPDGPDNLKNLVRIRTQFQLTR